MSGARVRHYDDMEQRTVASRSYADMHAEITHNLTQAMRDARADGYEQAIREVIEEFGDLAWETGLDSTTALADELQAWAWHRGIEIDLSAKEG